MGLKESQTCTAHVMVQRLLTKLKLLRTLALGSKISQSYVLNYWRKPHNDMNYCYHYQEDGAFKCLGLCTFRTCLKLHLSSLNQVSMFVWLGHHCPTVCMILISVGFHTPLVMLRNCWFPWTDIYLVLKRKMNLDRMMMIQLLLFSKEKMMSGLFLKYSLGFFLHVTLGLY